MRLRLNSRRLVCAVFGPVLVAAPFVAILILGLPSWFPFQIALDTVTPIRPGAAWGEPAWSLAGRLSWSLFVAASVVGLMNLRGWSGRWLPISWLLAGLAVPQACIWMTGQSKPPFLIGGLIPFSDASMYVDYAYQILENHRIFGSATDRLMFSALLSSLLSLSGSNLQVALGILLAICGAGMGLAAREMHRRFGTVAAIVFLFVIYTFYNRSIGVFMTEHLGLALGLFAFVLLLRGLLEPRRGPWLAGLFLLSVALCARSGAFFVLATLCLLTGRLFKKSGRFSLPACALAICLGLIPFGLNRLLLVRLVDSKTQPYSNFSYTAYGVLRGTNWHDAINTFGQDHGKIRQATYDLIKKDPYLVLYAVRRTWRVYFLDSYGFIFMGPDWSRLLLSFFILALALGIARVSRSRYDGFTVAVGAGALASIPFLPPSDADWQRVYAATMPLQACLAATGVAAPVRFVTRVLWNTGSVRVGLIETPTAPGPEVPACISVTGLALVLIFVLPLGRSYLLPENAGYLPISGKQLSRYPSGLSINLVSDEVPRTRVPSVRISDFRARLAGFWDEEGAWLTRLPAGTSVVYEGTNAIVISSADKLRHTGGRAEFVKFSIGGLDISRDKELPLSESAVAQSSTYASNTGSANAVDGNTDGNFSNNSISHTSLDRNAWWQVDLGASADISSIHIWNRTDCCPERLGDYWVLVSDTPFGPGDTPSTLQNRPSTWSNHQSTAPSPSTTIPVDTKGRYVRVQLSGENYLSIAEVQVIKKRAGQ